MKSRTLICTACGTMCFLAALSCSSTEPKHELRMGIWGGVVRVMVTDSAGHGLPGIPMGFAEYQIDVSGPQGIAGCHGYLNRIDSAAAVTDLAGTFVQSLYVGGVPMVQCIAVFAQPPQGGVLTSGAIGIDSVVFQPVDDFSSVPSDTIELRLRLTR